MILESPLNPLSIGNVGFNFARELWRLKQFNGFFPVSDNYDLSAYEPVEEEFKDFLDTQREVSLQNLSRGDSVLKCWHLNDSQRKLTDNQYLYTFYEVDSPTPEEVAIVNLQNHTFFSSQESLRIVLKRRVVRMFHMSHWDLMKTFAAMFL